MNTKDVNFIFTEVAKILAPDFTINCTAGANMSILTVYSSLQPNIFFKLKLDYKSYLLTIVSCNLQIFNELGQLVIIKESYFILQNKSHLINFIADHILKMESAIRYKLYRITLN
jgi:hypothetical protein